MMRWALLHAKKLVLELIGRSSNLILVDSDGRIIDCMRRMDFAGDAERSMMPGMFYRMPPKQNKAVRVRRCRGRAPRAHRAGG